MVSNEREVFCWEKNMSEIEPSLSRIEESLFDPMQKRNREEAAWRIGADAARLETLSSIERDAFLTQFAPSSVKAERLTALPSDPKVILGGLCSIFTGDLETGEARKAVEQIRMDQLVESVGGVRDQTTFVIVEDSNFSRLTGLPVKALQEQATMAIKGIERWLAMTTGTTPNLRVGYTSDPILEKGINESVRYMANDVLRNPNFERLQSAPIVMMYTSIWTDLLASLCLIPSCPVVCVEPAVHFVDSRTFPDATLQNAYNDFIEWLKDNPYAKPGSANANLGIVGFLESVTGDQSKRRTRLLPWTDVPTTQNVTKWTNTLQETTTRFPFPLRNSLIFAEAVNWGLWNPETRQQVSALIRLEEEYYQVRNLIKTSEEGKSQKQEQAKNIKERFAVESLPLIQAIAKQITIILTTVLGD
ncbi:hypothetical protein A2971_01030 [Candidatus Gottesmanbacteria bacterium RIFCSPLOWO2_01_FULL_46_21]|uniref:Uncharacterized protein n=1 Tax=Candidatus Gottesmanbacteria bacterium RIFCSPLOWO2_01_FULL_46_21 TaxID=1798393 RepID=A0A1F6AYB0_9BACT|nr:MAG: hypothetical protein A2971_01030 [Candidatus Gottesmanbacteria bacterium RIFCSPLOWO2_01_FULL_46_21]